MTLRSASGTCAMAMHIAVGWIGRSGNLHMSDRLFTGRCHVTRTGSLDMAPFSKSALCHLPHSVTDVLTRQGFGAVPRRDVALARRCIVQRSPAEVCAREVHSVILAVNFNRSDASAPGAFQYEEAMSCHKRKSGTWRNLLR